jgi:hypothetical protein
VLLTCARSSPALQSSRNRRFLSRRSAFIPDLISERAWLIRCPSETWGCDGDGAPASVGMGIDSWSHGLHADEGAVRPALPERGPFGLALSGTMRAHRAVQRRMLPSPFNPIKRGPKPHELQENFRGRENIFGREGTRPPYFGESADDEIGVDLGKRELRPASTAPSKTPTLPSSHTYGRESVFSGCRPKSLLIRLHEF